MMAAPRVESMPSPSPVAKKAPRIAPPCAMVVFGASGDLTRRKLMPALYNLTADGSIGEHFAVLGVARKPQGADEFRSAMRDAVAEFSRLKPEPEPWNAFATGLDYVTGDFADPATYERVSMRLQQLDFQRGLEGNRLFYLAVPSSAFAGILKGLAAAGLLRPPGGAPWARVVIEKPFGHDLDSAHELNQLLAEILDETQTFRIDHYLGKESVQNILVFRFANSIFEPLWNRKYVDYVEIAAAESIGVEGRGPFYDQTGVLRDIVQNHLMEVLALTAMEPPTTGAADDIRTEKLKIVNALRDPWSDTIPRDVVLGQYKGYRQEPGVAPDSVTPTFAALRVFVDNWRWQGVPFYLRAGKRLAKRVTDIAIHMQPIPLSLFGRNDVCDNLAPNVLSLRLQPDEGIQLEFASKIPGEELEIGKVKMDMTYVETFGGQPHDAYERLLMDAMLGDLTRFSRRDWVEASWAWIDPILKHYEDHPPSDFPNYEPASWGPAACDSWMKRDHRQWREL
jgi:glucose-6-phosphate 1-dehydrogenase